MTKRYREEIDEVELAPVPAAAEVTAGYTTGPVSDGDPTDGTGGTVVGGPRSTDAPASGRRSPAPARFRWRGRRYQVTSVLGHWYEDAGWWRRTDGVPERIERTDLWRVEAGDRREGGADAGHGVYGHGVYELVCRGNVWRLDRVWD